MEKNEVSSDKEIIEQIIALLKGKSHGEAKDLLRRTIIKLYQSSIVQ